MWKRCGKNFTSDFAHIKLPRHSLRMMMEFQFSPALFIRWFTLLLLSFFLQCIYTFNPFLPVLITIPNKNFFSGFYVTASYDISAPPAGCIIRIVPYTVFSCKSSCIISISGKSFRMMIGIYTVILCYIINITAFSLIITLFSFSPCYDLTKILDDFCILFIKMSVNNPFPALGNVLFLTNSNGNYF